MVNTANFTSLVTPAVRIAGGRASVRYGQLGHKPNGALALAIMAAVALALPLLWLTNADLPLRLLFTFSALVPLLIAALALTASNFFSILVFYSLIYWLEFYGGLVSFAWLPEYCNEITIAQYHDAALLYTCNYWLFLIGYLLVYMLRPRSISSGHLKRTHVSPESNGQRIEWMRLFLLVSVLQCCSLVKWGFRIAAAGGISNYLANAYVYRYGTYAETAELNAVAVLANILASAAFPILGSAWLLYWRRSASVGVGRMLVALTIATLLLSFLSGYRSTFFFTLLSLVCLFDRHRPIPLSVLVTAGIALVGLLLTYTWLHFYMYYITADWDYRSFAETTLSLLAPQGHIATLSHVHYASMNSPHLAGAGIVESLLFFIPRVVWTDKLEEFGTMAVQSWATLPTHYQMAVTLGGELLAHWGPFGLIGVVCSGCLHGQFDLQRKSGSIVQQAAVICLVIPRLLVHAGMGISALAQTLLSFVLVCGLARLISRQVPRVL